MTLSNYVDISILQDSVGLARRGFGIPAIVSHTADWAERVRYYTQASEVLADSAGFSATSPEYLTAVAFGKQVPKPKSFMIVRAGVDVTCIYKLTPIAAVNNQLITVGCSGDGVTAEEVSFTTDATNTVAETVIGLTSNINGVTSKNFTASNDTTHCTVTANSANEWFALEIDPNFIKVEQIHADPGMAAALTAIQLEDSAWYMPTTHFNSNAYCLAVAAWISTQKKAYIFDVAESDAINTTVGNSDTLDDIATANYGRIAGVYHPRPADFLAASWAGKCLPSDPGSLTWNAQTLVGPAPASLNATQRANLVAREANFYEQVTVDASIMTQGTTADGDFIDVQRGLDWWDDDLSKSVMELMIAADKIDMDQPGIILTGSTVLASASRAVSQRILKADPAPVLTLPDAADITPSDKAARILRGLQISGEFRGAIHKLYVTASIS